MEKHIDMKVARDTFGFMKWSSLLADNRGLNHPTKVALTRLGCDVSSVGSILQFLQTVTSTQLLNQKGIGRGNFTKLRLWTIQQLIKLTCEDLAAGSGAKGPSNL